MKRFEIRGFDKVSGFDYCMPVEPEDNLLQEMIDPEEIVHSGEKVIKIKFDYPLSTEVIMDFENPRGSKDWTRKEIFSAIRKGYNEIYYLEDMALDSDKKVTPFGIWGHSIYDLVIESVHMNKKGILVLDIGS
jgi:hypothetical protein